MFAKNYQLYWIADRANILSKYTTYICQFWAWLCGSFTKSFLNYFVKLTFAALYIYIYELKMCVSDF